MKSKVFRDPFQSTTVSQKFWRESIDSLKIKDKIIKHRAQISKKHETYSS